MNGQKATRLALRKPFVGDIARAWWKWASTRPVWQVPPVPSAARAGMGSAARARAELEFLLLLRDLDLFRPKPTARALLRSRADVFKAASLATPEGECPLFLSFRVRRKYQKGTRSSDYVFERAFVPSLRFVSKRLLGSWCPAYRPVNESEDAIRSGVHTKQLRTRRDSLAVFPSPRDWCARNRAPCLSCRKASLRAAYADPDGLASWRGVVSDQSDIEAAVEANLSGIWRNDTGTSFDQALARQAQCAESDHVVVGGPAFPRSSE